MSNNVKIYSTPSCVYCFKAKDFFKSHNVDYQEFNVSTDQQAREEMINITGQMAVPVIDIDGKVIVGFDEAAMKRALGIA